MTDITKKKQIRAGIILSYLQMSLSIVIGIVYTPAMIRLLGQSEYGLFSTTASAISVLSVLSLGFGSGYIRYYAKYKSNNDLLSIYQLNGLFLCIFTIIGLVAFLICIYLISNIKLIFDDGLTDVEYIIAKKLLILLSINLSLSFPASVFNTIISANEQFIFQKLVNMGKTVLVPIFTIPLLYLGLKSIAVVSVMVGLTLIVEIVNVYYVIFILKNRFYFNHFERGLFKSLFVYTSFIMINTIVRQINWNVDKVLLGRYQGTAMVAVYAVASSLHVYYENFSTSISNVFRTRVHMIVNTTTIDSNEQRDKLTYLFTKVGRIQFLVLGLIASGLIFFGYDFITQIWAGPGYEESYIVTLLLVLPTTMFLIQNLGIDIQRALNRHKFRSIAYLVMSVLNLILTIYLCQQYGAVGAALGTAVSVFLVDGIILNIYYHKRCNIDIILFWKEILKSSFGIIIPVAFGIYYKMFFAYESIHVFLCMIVLYSILYIISIYFISLNNVEKERINQTIVKTVRRFF